MSVSGGRGRRERGRDSGVAGEFLIHGGHLRLVTGRGAIGRGVGCSDDSSGGCSE